MSWFRSDDAFWRHRKVRKLGRTRVTTTAQVACVGLWQLAGTWSSDNTSDGFVPREQVEQWDPRLQLAERLVAAGLWHEATVDGEDGYRFHDWGDYNPSAAEVAEKKAKRAAAGRRGGVKSGESRRSKTEANASPPTGHENITGTSQNRPYPPVGPSVTRQFDDPNSADLDTPTTPDQRNREANASPVLEAKPNPVPTPIGATHLLEARPESNTRETREPEHIPHGPSTTGPNGATAWHAVRALIPTAIPHTVRGQLANQAQKLLDDGHTGQQITAALTRWLQTPNAGPGLLPHLLADLVKEANGVNAYGVRSSGSGARSARSEKVQGWAELGRQMQEQLDAGGSVGFAPLLIEGGQSA